AVLVQKDDEGKEYAVAYASHRLTKAEKNYSTIELEYLIVLWAIESFWHYLGLDTFIVVTDYIALKWLQTSTLTSRRAHNTNVLFWYSEVLKSPKSKDKEEELN
ncbi:11959_t:CDS:2, partial [Gigaspora rosea]